MDQEKEINIKKREFYLSNERTFLSYIRTSASVLVLAVALFKFFTDSAIIALGVVCLIVGCLVVALGLYRFLSEKNRIKTDDFTQD
jgi:uncharacterized membrane protein YidH (DUF202 family)